MSEAIPETPAVRAVPSPTDMSAGALSDLHGALSRAQMIMAELAHRMRQRGQGETAMHGEVCLMACRLAQLDESLQPTVLL